MNHAFIQGIGPLELTIVLVIVLLILGPKRLPAMGRSLGTGMREFKRSVTGRHDDDAPDDDRAAAAAAFGRLSSEQPPAEVPVVAVDERPLEGEIVRERR